MVFVLAIAAPSLECGDYLTRPKRRTPEPARDEWHSSVEVFPLLSYRDFAGIVLVTGERSGPNAGQVQFAKNDGFEP